MSNATPTTQRSNLLLDVCDYLPIQSWAWIGDSHYGSASRNARAIAEIRDLRRQGLRVQITKGYNVALGSAYKTYVAYADGVPVLGRIVFRRRATCR